MKRRPRACSACWRRSPWARWHSSRKRTASTALDWPMLDRPEGKHRQCDAGRLWRSAEGHRACSMAFPRLRSSARRPMRSVALDRPHLLASTGRSGRRARARCQRCPDTVRETRDGADRDGPAGLADLGRAARRAAARLVHVRPGLRAAALRHRRRASCTTTSIWCRRSAASTTACAIRSATCATRTRPRRLCRGCRTAPMRSRAWSACPARCRRPIAVISPL